MILNIEVNCCADGYANFYLFGIFKYSTKRFLSSLKICNFDALSIQILLF
jgi:hypothetical protein